MKIATQKNSAPKRVSRTLMALVATLLFLSLVPSPAFSSSPPYPAENSRLSQALAARENIATIRLVGVTSYEMTKLFQELLGQLDGVLEVKPYRFNLNPDRPRNCSAEWRVKLADNNDLFELESRLYHRLRELAAARPGEFPTLTRELTPYEIEALGFIEPRQAGSHFLTFVQTRRLAANRHPGWPGCDGACCPVDYPGAGSFNHGFE